MLIFHEGLPRSGKSYAAVKDHIVPALAKGRKVFAYIEGLDHQKIADLAGIGVDRCRELLIQITRDQVKDIWQHVENDSLVVIDELANFWPAGRQQLNPETLQFIKEHGHRGLDVLLMDQVMNDSHNMWKGRVDTKISFTKRDAAGKDDEYTWVVYKRVPGDKIKFQEVTKGKAKYDPLYFGTYKSHTDGTENKGNYSDDRANIKNSKAWRVAKIYTVIVVVALAFVVWFFSTGGGGMGQKKPEPAPAKTTKTARVDPNAIAAAENAKVVSTLPKVEPSNATEIMKQAQDQASDYIHDLSEKGRVRLGGTVKTAKRMTGIIEFRDQSNRVLEAFTPEQLQALGWYVMLAPDGSMATISRPGKTLVATQWPIKDDRAAGPERVPDATQRTITTDTPAPGYRPALAMNP